MWSLYLAGVLCLLLATGIVHWMIRDYKELKKAELEDYDEESEPIPAGELLAIRLHHLNKIGELESYKLGISTLDTEPLEIIEAMS